MNDTLRGVRSDGGRSIFSGGGALSRPRARAMDVELGNLRLDTQAAWDHDDGE
jgi:hypothetical protein